MKNNFDVDVIIPTLMPAGSSASLLGISSEKFHDNYRVIHPLLLKALQEHTTYITTGDVLYSTIIDNFYYVMFQTENIKEYYPEDDFHHTWRHMLGLTLSAHKNLSKKLFHEVESFRGHTNQIHTGLDMAILYFVLQRKEQESLHHYYKKNLMSYIPQAFNTREERHNALMFLQVMLLDYGYDALEWDDNTQTNMMYFYTELPHMKNLSYMYMSSWDTNKYTLLNEAERLAPWIFEKLVKADLPLARWHEHEELPREWVIGLYQ